MDGRGLEGREMVKGLRDWRDGKIWSVEVFGIDKFGFFEVDFGMGWDGS